MLVSYNWLNKKYLGGQLPPVGDLVEALTFHAWEIEDVKEISGDTILDVKVLPDKSMWALSHRGIAKDISVILDLPLSADPFIQNNALSADASVGIKIDSANCRRFAAAKITGVKVGPSPEWLKTALESIGQRSINNIVDASNYVMFDLGQPSHAFDASMVGGSGFLIRDAKDGEKLTGLDGIEYTFTQNDTVIARADNGEILSIAGLKGGQHSGISENTTDVIVEVANWNPITTRKTGRRLKLRTDASARYENGIVPEVVPLGLSAVVELIIEVAGGQIVGYSEEIKETTPEKSVTVSLAKINSVLGVSLTVEEVEGIIKRFGWNYQINSETFTIESPFERTDLVIGEDVIEEIGRVYGYQHVTAVTPEAVPLKAINKRFYYYQLILETLTSIGFSEIYTSSFRNSDQIKISNALATDKGYLRSSLKENIKEALAKNAPNADLLGVRQIKIFEIGTVFTTTGEYLRLTLGVCSPSGYKAKTDDQALSETIEKLQTVLGVTVSETPESGLIEIDLGSILEKLPTPDKYTPSAKLPDVTYQTFSVYPAISRDIAMWVPESQKEEIVLNILQASAGNLCVRISLFDKFSKDDRVSYAFRLVFQSKEKTLTDNEINDVMTGVYESVKAAGFEVR